MSYKIAIGSSDGINVDLKFGEVSAFMIYEAEGTKYSLAEKREVNSGTLESQPSGCEKSSCAPGCSGNGGGCGGNGEADAKVSLIADCRCVVCKKIGFQAQKQFERKAISVFDVECSIEEALEKITGYYDKIDKRISLRV